MPFPFERKPIMEQILQQWIDWGNYILINGFSWKEDERHQLAQMIDRTKLKLKKLQEQ